VLRSTEQGSGGGSGNALAFSFVPASSETEGRTIVFIDESGLSERPYRCRTWAPKGKTPVPQYHFNWKTLSAIGA